MSSLWSQYSPLETLLLFQSLACYGVDLPAFARISHLLNSNPSVRDAPTYDSRRLSPDALRDLYLILLREEVKEERQDANETVGQNGDTSPSRKRKAPSPSLPTVHDAAQHSHLLPRLITKLYMRYRQHAIDGIRAEERKYDQLRREIEEIERGDWDDHLRHEANRIGVNGQSLPLDGNLPRPAPIGHVDPQGPMRRTASQASNSSTATQQLPAGLSQAPPSRRQSTKIEALINPPSSMPPSGSASPQKTPLPSPLQSNAGYPPSHQHPHARKSSQPLHVNPRLPPPQTSGPTYHMSSPYAPTHPGAAPGHGSPPSQSPKIPNANLQGRTASGPVVLPPPPGMPFPPAPVQVPSMPENGGPFRPPSGSPHQYPRPFPPSGQQSPAAHLQPNMQQGPRSFHPLYQAPPPYPPQHPQAPPQAQPPVYYPPPHQGGYMLPPFQVTPQDPVRAHQEQQRAMQQTAPTPRGPSARPAAPTPTRPQPALNTNTPSQPPNFPLPHPANRMHLKTPRPPPIHIGTPLGSWKKGLPQPFDAMPPPESNPAPVSPISPPGSPVLPKREPKMTKKKAESVAKSKEMLAPDTSARTARGTRKPPRKTRAGSAASSALTGSVRGRSRSQSVASHEEESALGVKADPGTPAGLAESDIQSTSEATPTSGARARRRAGTLQSTTSQTQEKVTNKRKRGTRETSETAEPDQQGTTSEDSLGPPTTVIASRNFNRMSVPVMNDITSHKHASLFSNPVKAKDAEGYYDIIRRPQDLKSIRAAITSGSRAVAAATASTADTPSAASPGPQQPQQNQQQPSTPNASASTGTQITLPISEDLVPPKGIVNSAQLEKELMRMFANAVMFNTGDEGVVGDAVEMAKDVESSVANWRAAERTNMEVVEDADDVGGAGGGPKRRKL